MVSILILGIKTELVGLNVCAIIFYGTQTKQMIVITLV